MEDPATESFLLGLLNRALDELTRAWPPREGHNITTWLLDARRRLYPGYQDTASIRCLTCVDTGLVCKLCCHRPCTLKCNAVQEAGPELMQACGKECEASQTPGLQANLELAVLKKQLADKDTKIEALEKEIYYLKEDSGAPHEPVAVNRSACSRHQDRSDPQCADCRAAW